LPKFFDFRAPSGKARRPSARNSGPALTAGAHGHGRTVFIVAVLLMVTTSGGCTSAPASNASVLTESTWGGEGAELIANGDEITLRFVCATGHVAHSFATDASGNFDFSGSYAAAGGARSDADNASRPVRFKGRVEGETMNLIVDFSGSEANESAFNLRRGAPGDIRPCP
jgi:hypothetical protein